MTTTLDPTRYPHLCPVPRHTLNCHRCHAGLVRIVHSQEHGTAREEVICENPECAWYGQVVTLTTWTPQYA